MAYIDVEHLYRRYHTGGTEIIANNDVTFSVEKGELVIILGASGAGKSTLLNILGGMDSPNEGRVVVAGRDIARLDRRELTRYRRTDVGFVFQFYNLVANLTAKENVELASEIVRDAQNPVEVLKLVGLEGRLNNFPAQLSGGEQQRVAIARALAKNPKLLLCDEPTGALDYHTGKAILRLLQDTCYDTGKTVVLITHNSAFTAIADRVIHIREGRVAGVEVNDAPASAETLEW